MTNVIQQFLAGRAERQASHITNAEQPVTRAEFNTLVRAVHGLIEDVDAALSPEKLTATMNAAFGEAMKGRAPIANARRGNPLSQYLAPSDDDDGQAIANQRNGRPAANKRLYLAPEGD
ncbi:hypothetical protein N6H05_07510 [Sphingobium sp. WTD-1]|uniref:hypothetical protein n=1 Tax=Sphingobium sp. WTD-1 TaxID=2979467 RepID=UPI0024DE569C|nr:hypothetical protein [Sphingobium sp. WTD-1]WIA57635.1 hypothetical protein N6H05_07510 [Sphingobium sp. WTD-1]